MAEQLMIAQVSEAPQPQPLEASAVGRTVLELVAQPVTLDESVEVTGHRPPPDSRPDIQAD
ncbi:MAG TPA: hypothetical protein VJR27_00260 [Candidatus Saccharimonadales bacterium]|nr:hypothetical protein [Candidatus Saccharimonadales bacterium]